MELVCVLSADKWRMTDDKTGEIREGVSIYYVNDYRDETEHSVGFRPTKAPASEAAFTQISEGGAPGLYELQIGSKPGKGGVPTLRVTGARLVEHLDLFPKE